MNMRLGVPNERLVAYRTGFVDFTILQCKGGQVNENN
jgi:hypothetical protein